MVFELGDKNMKFSILKVLSGVACVLVFQGVLGVTPFNVDENEGSKEHQGINLQEAMDVRDEQRQQLILDTISAQADCFLRFGNESDAIYYIKIGLMLFRHWQEQEICDQWDGIQQRIKAIAQLPEKDRNELELLQLNLQALNLAEEFPNLIDISSATPEFHAFVILQVTSTQKTLYVLRDWLRWVQRWHNNWNISWNLSLMSRNIDHIDSVLALNHGEEHNWDKIMEIKPIQSDLEAIALRINESLKSDYPNLTIPVYEQLIFQQQSQNQPATE